MKTHLLLSLMLVTAHVGWAQNSDLQSWTASDGRVIQAKFIKLDGESVVIEKDGKPFAVPFAKLSADSVALAKKLDAGANAATPTRGLVKSEGYKEISSIWTPDSRLCAAPDGGMIGTAIAQRVMAEIAFYRVTPDGTVSVLTKVTPKSNYQYGRNVVSGMVGDGKGNYFGRTYEGEHLLGTIYKMTGAGAFSTLVEFTGETGSFKGAMRKDPNEPAYVPLEDLLIDSTGSLIGATPFGGAGNFGTIFKYAPDGVFTTIVEFTGPEGGAKGNNPRGLCMDKASNVFGMAGNRAFKLTSSGQFSTLAEFEKGNPMPRSCDVVDSEGNVFGIGYESTGNAEKDRDFVFKLSSKGEFRILADFPKGKVPDVTPSNPQSNSYKLARIQPARLTEGTDGRLYCTSRWGVSEGKFGCLFTITKTGEMTKLAEFPVDESNPGTSPRAALTRDAEGNLYGTTEAGHVPGCAGTIFRLTKSEKMETLSVIK